MDWLLGMLLKPITMKVITILLILSKVNYSDIFDISKPIVELLAGEIQKMALCQIP